jgi:hypothetical protein
MLFLGPGRLSLDATLLPRLFKRGSAGGRTAPARMASATR